MKALVVDDSQIMRRIIISVLKKCGVEDVAEVTNGKEAVEMLAKSNDVGLVLMDWNMPVMSGIEALQQIRANNKTLPIVMVTTESEKGKVVEAIRAGANGYLLKPLKLHDLQERLLKHIEALKK